MLKKVPCNEIVSFNNDFIKMMYWQILIHRIIPRLLRRVRFAFCLKELSTWEYESCRRCGHCFRLCWQVSDDKWIAVHGNEGGCLCIDCFIELANKRGIKINNSDIRMELFNPDD